MVEAILLLLVVSRIAGEVAERYGQPAMLGEIAAGILLGPSVFNVVHLTADLQTIAHLGVLLLVFLAGLEMDLDELRRAVRGRGVWVGIMAFLTPLFLGIGLGLAFGFDRLLVIFLGLCIAITALPVSVRILMDVGQLRTEIGERVIAAAVMNDVAALLILGVILDLNGSDGGWHRLLMAIGWSILKTVLFMAAVLLVARAVRYSSGQIPLSKQLFGRLLTSMKGKEALFAVVFLFVLAFAALSDLTGLHFVIGAFFGAMILGHETLGRANFQALERTASSITNGFLGPIFFGTIGLEFQATALTNWPLLLAILIAAFAGKLLGGYWGGRMAGFPAPESWMLGKALNGRGIMELVIAKIALANAFITEDLFSMLIFMGTVTTFATPFLVRGYAASRSEGTDQRLEVDRDEPFLTSSVPFNPVNDAPIANPDRKWTIQDVALEFPAFDLLANDVDPDGDRLTVAGLIAYADTHGKVSLRGNRVQYEPDPGFTGIARFGYVVTDGQGGSATGTVRVRVAPRHLGIHPVRRPIRNMAGSRYDG